MPREASAQKISDEPLSTPQLVVLLLLDGWGVAPESEGNAIKKENSKHFFELLAEYPATVLKVPGGNESDRYSVLGGGGELAKILFKNKIKQVYLTESEKAAAVFGFFVGSENLSKVEKKVFSSPVCDSYELEPEMSIDEISRAAVKIIRNSHQQFVLISLANLDAVAASGNILAVKKAVTRVDSFIGKISEEVLLKKGVLLVSSASANVEKMIDIRTELVDKENTLNPVPFLVVGEDFKGLSLFGNDAPGGDLSLLEASGSLANVSSSILDIFGLEKPTQMKEESLLEK